MSYRALLAFMFRCGNHIIVSNPKTLEFIIMCISELLFFEKIFFTGILSHLNDALEYQQNSDADLLKLDQAGIVRFFPDPVLNDVQLYIEKDMLLYLSIRMFHDLNNSPGFIAQLYEEKTYAEVGKRQITFFSSGGTS